MKIETLKGLMFLMFFTSINCEVPFDDNKRLLIKGEIFDEENQPTQNADIGVFVRRDNSFSSSLGFNGSGGKLIGEGNSDADGSFSIITLLGRDENFSVEIYVNDDYTKYTYVTSTENFTPTELRIDLERAPIRLKSDANINITRTSPEGTELQYTLEYQTIFCKEVYFEEELDEVETFCYETQTISGVLNDENPNTSRDFLSLVDSEITLTYSINGQPEESQALTIDQADYEFNFSY